MIIKNQDKTGTKPVRVITLEGTINEQYATEIIAQLLYYNSLSKEPIELKINSNGGYITAGFAIIDAIDQLESPVWTHCTDKAHSIAAIILASGEKGYRSASKDSKISFSMPLLTTEGDCSEELLRMTNMLIEETSKHTGENKTIIRKLFESKELIDSERSIKLGIIDFI